MRRAINSRWIAAILFALGVGMPGTAFARCDLLAICTCVTSASGVAFGGYDPFSPTSTISTGTITVDCLLVVALAGSYDIAISTGSSNSYGQRTMTKGGSTLNYNLYTSPARTQIWGDGTGGSVKVTPTFGALLLFSQTANIYGEIPAGQNVASGGYTDTITITVTY